MDVKDKVIVITGGASGIGKALAELFAAEGAKAIAVTDRNADGVEAVAKAIGPVAQPYAMDVTDEAAVRKVVDEMTAKFGGVDLYVSNAGILFSDAPDWTAISQTEAQWDKIWKVNVYAHVIACRAVLPQMIARKSGGILITASAAGLLSQIGDTSYSTTKHAAVGFAESLAITHGDDGIWVGALCPQAVDTAMVASAKDSSATLDGVMPADELARRTLAAMRDGRFMIRPHEEVETYFKHKAENYDRWVGGMRKLRRMQMDKTGRPI